MFNNLADYTEPIFQAIDSSLANILAYDTTGIEAFVTKNNPKYINYQIHRLKTAHKNNPDVDPYKIAYALMPSHSAVDPAVKQMYINGHFCYIHKFGVLTNGLGIVRHIVFLDDDFNKAHPELIIERKSDSLDKDKSIGDSTPLG